MNLLEQKILSIKEDDIKIALNKSLILSCTRYSGSGDWSDCPSGYSYKDKQFLNSLFSKYGGFYFEEMLYAIFKLHIDKLLPEILLSVRDAFKFAVENAKKKDSLLFREDANNSKPITLKIITKAFLNFGGEIKQDDDLTKAFEEILEMLVDMSFEEAAIILDEFRIH